jgi:hypothetical protein
MKELPVILLLSAKKYLEEFCLEAFEYIGKG